MYISTRGNEKLTASQAILKGLASDGGLFFPESVGKIDVKACLNDSYIDIARKVFKLFLDDFSDEEIEYCLSGAYSSENFKNCFANVRNFDKISFLELYHGPTLAFKDMALTILPYFIEVAKKKHKVLDKSLILVATSGDTGGAALSSFMKNGSFDTVVLYPHGGVSEIQEKQMLYYTNDRTKAYAVEGNFDDCQTFVKEIFSSYPKNNGVLLSSANSINIGRLVPQIVYYIYSYVKMVNDGVIKFGERVNYCVPTGNFGDIFAGYLAKLLGAPIDKLICASNVNKVLTDFFNKGIYDKRREFIKSNSPAMDILVSSNLERLIYLASGKDGSKVNKYMKELSANGYYQISDEEREFLSCFMAQSSNEEETLKTINKVFRELGYLIDPHTAVAVDCYNKLKIQGNRTVIVSTASPYKFPFTVSKALGIDSDKSEFEIIKDVSLHTNTIIPYGISKLQGSNKNTIIKNKEEIKDKVLYKNLKATIKVPCSTANLGSAFDSSGISLSLYNTFTFEQSEKDVLVNFLGKPENNLVLNSYKALFKKLNKKYIPVKITLNECNIPLSRGLGSSASCIVAGVVGANYMLKGIATNQEILNVLSELEGHPDNVAPCYLGGLVSSIMVNGEVVSVKCDISNDLNFYALIPEFELSTKKAREVLPKTIAFKDAIFNLSRTAILHNAFSTGDINKIKLVLEDKLHEQYRYPLIKGGVKVKKYLEEKGFVVAISGAGPTLLAISKNKELLDKQIKYDGITYKIIKLQPDLKGVSVND